MLKEQVAAATHWERIALVLPKGLAPERGTERRAARAVLFAGTVEHARVLLLVRRILHEERESFLPARRRVVRIARRGHA